MGTYIVYYTEDESEGYEVITASSPAQAILKFNIDFENRTIVYVELAMVRSSF